MQWTYFSTLSHVTLFILAYWVWFSGLSGRLELAVLFTITGVVVVALPSTIAYKGVVRTRSRRASTTASVVLTPDAVEKMWARPVLPFKFRSAISAAALYVIVPLLAAVLSRS